MEREVGGGIRMGNTCKPMAVSFQCMTKSTTNKKKKRLRKKEKERSPPPACVRAEIRHQRDGKQKPNKQRESLQKGPVQQVKNP